MTLRQSVGLAQAFTLSLTLKAHPSTFSVVRYTGLAMWPRTWGNCWISVDSGRINGIVRAGKRAGRTCWEVKDLYVTKESRQVCSALLEKIAVEAGHAGARRLFLRLPHDSMVFNEARRAGFQPQYSERLFRCNIDNESKSPHLFPSGYRCRTRQPEDDNQMFFLQHSRTPENIRSYLPMNTQEWRDGLEHPPGSVTDQVVINRDGRLDAWSRIGDAQDIRYLSMMSRPGKNELSRHLFNSATRNLDGRPLVALVPSFDQVFTQLFENVQEKFQENYELLVKPIALPVSHKSHMMVATG